MSYCNVKCTINTIRDAIDISPFNFLRNTVFFLLIYAGLKGVRVRLLQPPLMNKAPSYCIHTSSSLTLHDPVRFPPPSNKYGSSNGFFRPENRPRYARVDFLPPPDPDIALESIRQLSNCAPTHILYGTYDTPPATAQRFVYIPIALPHTTT